MDGEGATLTKIAMSPFSKIVSSGGHQPQATPRSCPGWRQAGEAVEKNGAGWRVSGGGRGSQGRARHGCGSGESCLVHHAADGELGKR